MSRFPRTTPLLLLAALAACSSRAPSAPTAPTQPTGPTAAPTPPARASSSVLLAANEEPAVSFAAWFQVGSSDDPAGKEGIAWLTGQMVARAATKANR